MKILEVGMKKMSIVFSCFLVFGLLGCSQNSFDGIWMQEDDDEFVLILDGNNVTIPGFGKGTFVYQNNTLTMTIQDNDGEESESICKYDKSSDTLFDPEDPEFAFFREKKTKPKPADLFDGTWWLSDAFEEPQKKDGAPRMTIEGKKAFSPAPPDLRGQWLSREEGTLLVYENNKLVITFPKSIWIFSYDTSADKLVYESVDGNTDDAGEILFSRE
jgi:hypothetical protein